MTIKYYPKTGEVLECDFGPDYPRKPSGEVDRVVALTTSGNLPPEMVKNRLVVVLNGKLGEGCIVVPLTTTKQEGKVKDAVHVFVDRALIAGHKFFTDDSWACGEQVQQVSKLRLQTFHPDPARRPVLSKELMDEIKKAVIKAIRATDLIVAGPETHEELPKLPVAPPPAPELKNSMADAFEVALTKKVDFQGTPDDTPQAA